MSEPVSIGAIPSLNDLPLTAPLRAADPSRVRVVWDAPARLADLLRRGELDLALVPQVELSRDPDYRFLPGRAIACDGAVESILLFHHGPVEGLDRVEVDAASRSSVELLRILLHRRTGRTPEIVRTRDDFSPADLGGAPERGLLCIGDRALAARHHAVPRTDLGAWWREETGLPFVFALWIGRAGLDPAVLAIAEEAARQGARRRETIGREFAAEHPEVIDGEGAARYLTDTLHHTCGERELASIARFAQERREIGGAVPEGWQPLPFPPPRLPAEEES